MESRPVATSYPNPLHTSKHNRFTEQDVWRVWDVSLSRTGKIALSGQNKDDGRSFIDVYLVSENSNGEIEQKPIYSKEFQQILFEGVRFSERYVSLVEPNGDSMATCSGNRLEMIAISNHEPALSAKMRDRASGVVAKKREIFVPFYGSNKINVYNLVDLSEIRSIELGGLNRGDHPIDIQVESDRIFACLGQGYYVNHKCQVFSKIGELLSTFSSPDGSTWYAWSITVNVQLGVVAVAWTSSVDENEGISKHVFYSLMGESTPSFLVVEDEADASLLRITDSGERIVTVNHVLGDMKIYDMAETFTYDHLKRIIANHLTIEDCRQLASSFSLSEIRSQYILNSETPEENLLLALENEDVIQPADVSRLRERCGQTQGQLMCKKVTDVYDRTRTSRFYKSTIQELRAWIHTSKEENQRLKNRVVTTSPGQEAEKQQTSLETEYHRTGLLNVQSTSSNMHTQQTITNDGGTMCIPETDVRLQILPNSLTKGVEQVKIQMKIIPGRLSSNLPICSFASNSSVVVELLPNHLQLQRCALLTLPHCLKLKTTSENVVKVFVSHHSKDSEPCWEEKPQLKYLLDDKALTLHLDTFCWVRYEINDDIVQAKRIQVFAARPNISQEDESTKVELGYYPDLPGAGEILRNNQELVNVVRKSYLFFREGNGDLKIVGSHIVPANWEYHNGENFKRISFAMIASSVETSCPLLLQRINTGNSYCVFQISQARAAREVVELSLSFQATLADDVVRAHVVAAPRHPEPVTEGEFAEFLVSVAVRLTNTNCVYLANYFNFPPPVIELVRRDLETPGITLINIMRERNVINMHDVTGLQRALSGLELNDINEVLVIPYQERIDFFR